jgi:hypothetical protein
MCDDACGMAKRAHRWISRDSVAVVLSLRVSVAMRATAHVAFPGLASAPRAGPSRRGPVRVMANREQLSSATSQGLALSGSVMALNGGLAKFAVRDDVSVSRTEESGKTTVTIKARATHNNTLPGPSAHGSQRAAQRASTASHHTPGCLPPPQAAPCVGVSWAGGQGCGGNCYRLRLVLIHPLWRPHGPHTRALVSPAPTNGMPVPAGGRAGHPVASGHGGLFALRCGVCASRVALRRVLPLLARCHPGGHPQHHGHQRGERLPAAHRRAAGRPG